MRVVERENGRHGSIPSKYGERKRSRRKRAKIEEGVRELREKRRAGSEAHHNSNGGCCGRYDRPPEQDRLQGAKRGGPGRSACAIPVTDSTIAG